MALDHTHEQTKRSWVASANRAGTDFPIQNLPLGVFSRRGDAPRCGVAIGDFIFDLAEAASRGLLGPDLGAVVSENNLDALLALGRPALRRLRHEVFAILEEGATERPQLLARAAECMMLLPTSIRSYTDFFAGIHHAVRAGQLGATPETPLPPNYKWLPLAYNGRASSVRPSGEGVRRPLGQWMAPGAASPSCGPSQRLDFELEMGAFVGPGTELGDPLPIGQAGDQVVGFCLLNDWSARDIQFWEMPPLGPFSGKSFSTTISPWVITADALEPFRAPPMERGPGDQDLPPYLLDAEDQAHGGLDAVLRATIQTEKMRAEGHGPVELLTTNARHLYWTFAQMLVQQAFCGCNLKPGDLIGTGTISGPKPEQLASLFEISAAGQEPLVLPNGETRTYLENGDEVTFTGRCVREGFVSIGFGACAGRIEAAPELAEQARATAVAN